MLVKQLDWTKYGYVMSSVHRQRVVMCLRGNPKTPKEIGTRTGLPLSHVSRVIKDLANRDILKCVTPDLKKGRLFALTREGKDIMRLVSKTI